MLLRFVHDYDQHHRYFKEVGASKLVLRNGETFQVYFRFVRKKVVTVHYNRFVISARPWRQPASPEKLFPILGRRKIHGTADRLCLAGTVPSRSPATNSRRVRIAVHGWSPGWQAVSIDSCDR